jgi:signal transduction histidine kinase
MAWMELPAPCPGCCTGLPRKVRGSTQDGLAVIEVEDDGVGVDDEHARLRAEGGHVGLRTLEGLVRDAGGTLDLKRVEPRGTVLRVQVPLA